MTERIVPPRTDDAEEIRRFRLAVTQILNKTASAQADSTAASVADLKDDFNALLAKLRTTGWIAS